MRKLFAIIIFLIVPLSLLSQNKVNAELKKTMYNLFNNHKDKEALPLCNQLISKYQKQNKENTVDYAELLSVKASILYHLKDTKCIEIGKQAVGLTRKLLGKYNTDYMNKVTYLASYCYWDDRYPDCINLENEALDVAEKLGKKVDYSRLAKMCNETGDQKRLGINHVQLIGREMYDYFGLYSSANGLETTNLLKRQEEYKTSQKQTGGDGLDFAQAEENLALACASIGDTANAQKYIYDATCIRVNCLGENNLETYRSILLNLSILAMEGQTPFVKDMGLYVLNSLEKNKFRKTREYIDALILVGFQYAHMGVSGSASEYIGNALKLAKKYFGAKSTEYDRARFASAQILLNTSNLSYNEIDKKALTKIIKLVEETYSWRILHYGLENRDCIISLLALADCYDEDGQYQKAYELYRKFISAQSEIVKENFIAMTDEQQRGYWHMISRYYQESIPQLLWDSGIKKINDASVLYDATLFSKGLLLKSFTARHESELKGDADSYDKFINNLSVTWKDIQKHLGPKDVAIEFVNFKKNKLRFTRTVSKYIQKGDKTDYEVSKTPTGIEPVSIYLALLVMPGLNSPIVIPLCDADKEGDFEINGHMQNDLLYRIFWEKLMPVLRDKRNIYFSPFADLYNIPLESIIDPKSREPLSNKYKFYRLSSTSILAEDKIEYINKNAVVYGNITYNLSTSQIAMYKRNSSKHNNAISYTIKVRGGKRGAVEDINPLPGTRTEAMKVAKSINSKSATYGHTTIYQGISATETSLKSLSGKNMRIMHIATHGFYEPDDDIIPIVQEVTDKDFCDEDLAMMQSGLFFSGAQNTLNGESLPVNLDDGILTAHEISKLDFHNMELVSLSACQTGLGEITGDGVFGLQRGFKMAGVKSILMSLWKVDDAATCKLMTEFYTNWISKKMSKHDALEAAKKTVRTTKGWEDPKYWAAFILLDGLD